MNDTKSVLSSIEIRASASAVWDVITNPDYAKVLGSEFDTNAFVESDWKLGSKVDFKYATEPEKACNTGTISKLIEEKLIQVDYRFFFFWKYAETYSLQSSDDGVVLQINAGPYGSDLPDHKVAWKNWLAKVKELSETKD
ncbi:activator of Hsp90 ATPase-like protein [Rubidibacter lacunae KORDI 51-2]|uniref:Activator of Hsp90 ATPase-like protein n=1 Tax=Rubidibacter lacunae KORDI 51-2 TaxID=582515 RepID=U5DDQ6_9CHRO|nr:SRPBCC domain-containing protein [Rubidibacter lacunae]ERN42643.1 activator of Hsp90 ATPase-like protein [Rubidibacter lacunae KORDI 51-2]